MDRAGAFIVARAAPLGLLLVVGVWLVLGLPGLGDYGLWDPWEMDQAAVARRMIGPTRVLAVEHASASQPGPAAAWLSARYADALYVGTLDTSSAAAAARDVDLRNRAQKRLDAEIFHVLVLDGKAFFTDPASHADVRTLVEWLDPVIGRNPGMEVLLLVPPGTSASTLRSTYADVRVDLAGRELLGSSFPRSDTFRRDLQKWLKPAKEGTWAPFAHLVPAAADDGFLVKAFWRAARARRLDEALASPLPEALSAQLAEAPLFQLPAAVLEWPAAADYQALLKDFQTGGAEAPQSARAAATAVEGAIDRTLGRPAWRAQFKARGQTWSVPPLDYWLMAASFRRLGFSELASRLPAFCLGLVGLVGLFWVALRLFGPGAATLSGLVLCTCPIFFAQARSVAGGVSFATALVLIIGSTAVMIQAGRIRAGALVVLAVGSVMAFLAEGLFGLLVPTTCLVAYVLAARDLRPAALVPAGLLAAALGALWLVVARSGDWSFWSHFDLRAALWSWDPSPAARAHNLNFDVLIRQIGFGAAPWSVLIPFGIGLFAMDFARDRSRTAILIVLWFLVPFAVGGALLKHGNHLVYQAIPAGCLAVGVLLHRAWRGHGLSAVAGLTAAIILGILIREVGKSPEPLTSFLTVDPPFNVKKSGTPYPDGMHLPGALKAALGLVALLFLWHAARLASRARRIAVGLARPRVFWWGFSALATLLVALLLSRVESQIALSFNGPTGALLEGVHRVFVRDVFYWRPESWLVIAGGAGALLLAGYRPVLSAVGRWLRAWVLVPFAGWSLAVGLAGGALVAAAAGSEDGLFAAADHLLALVVLTLVPIAGRFALGRRAAPPGVPRGVRAHGLAGLRLLLGTGGPAAAVCLGLCWALLHVAAGLAAEPEAVPPALALALAGTFFLGLTDVLAEPRAGLRAAGMATAGALIWALAVRAAAGPVGLGALGLPLGIGVTATLVELDVLARLGRGITASMRWLGQTPAVATGAAGLALVGTLALGGTGSAGATAANPAVWVGVGITALAWWLGRRRMLGVTPYGAFDATTPVLLLAASVAFVGGTITGRITGFPGRLPQDLAADRISAGVLAAMLAIAALLAVVRFVMVRPRPLARTFHLGTGALLLALAALGLVLRFGSPDPNRIGWATWQSPAFWLSSGALLCLAALAALAWLDRGERWLPPRSLFHGLRRLRNPALLYGLALFIGFVGITAMTVQLLKETPLTLAHFAALGPAQTIDAAMIRSQGLLIALLIALPGLLWLGLLAPWIRARPARGVAVALPLGLILSAQMLWPLVRKWQQLESAVQGLDAEPFLPYLFWGSRVTRLLYIGIAALALVFVAGRVPAILRRLRDPRALVEAAAISVFALLLWVALPPIAGLIRGVDSATLWSGAAGSASLRAKAAALVAVLLVGLVGLDRRMRGGTAVRLLRVGELVERPRVFIVLLAAATALATFFYNQRLVQAFSFHVSQKHLIETVRRAQGGTLDPSRLFQHGIGQRSDVNFYTKDIPEVKDISSAIRTLVGESDQVLILSEADRSVPITRVVPGFSAKNDRDGDGARDWPATTGLATAANPSERWIEDSAQAWTPDQWKGYVLVDADRWVFPVTGNTATRLMYDPEGATAPSRLASKTQSRRAPAFDAKVPSRTQYTVDHPEAADHGATAAQRARLFFMLPKVGSAKQGYSDSGSFSTLNHRFRKESGGRQLPVIDDRSSRILLATNALAPGETDRSWLSRAVLSQDEFSALVREGLVRGADAKNPRRGIISYEEDQGSNKGHVALKLLGWRMEDPTTGEPHYAFSKGKKFRIILYFLTVRPLTQSLKVFMHIDRQGQRIHSDHWILNQGDGEDGKYCVGCFQTNHWLPGDIVVDTFEKEVPIAAPPGRTDIHMGLYNPSGDKRLVVLTWDKRTVTYRPPVKDAKGAVTNAGDDNRANIGAFVVR